MPSEYPAVRTPLTERVAGFRTDASTRPHMAVLHSGLTYVNGLLNINKPLPSPAEIDAHVLSGNDLITYLRLDDPSTSGMSLESRLLVGYPEHIQARALEGDMSVFEGFGAAVRSTIGRHKTYLDHCKPGDRPDFAGKMVKDWAQVAASQIKSDPDGSGLETDLAAAIMAVDTTFFEEELVQAVSARPLPQPRLRIFTQTPEEFTTGVEAVAWAAGAQEREREQRREGIENSVRRLRAPKADPPSGDPIPGRGTIAEAQARTAAEPKTAGRKRKLAAEAEALALEEAS